MNRKRQSQTEPGRIATILFEFFQTIVKRDAVATSKLDERLHRSSGKLRRPPERDLILAKQ